MLRDLVMPDKRQVEIEIAAIVARVLGFDRIEIESDLYDLGADSQQAVFVALEIEGAFGVELPLDVLERTGSISALADWVIGCAEASERASGRDERA